MALQASVPNWFYRNSDDQFIVGNGSAPIKHKDDLVKAIALAKDDALQAISAQIYSEVRSLIDSRESSDGQSDSQFYAKEVQISSCIKLCGYEEVTNSVDRSYYYVQIQIPRKRMQEHYLTLVQDEISEAQSLSAAAKAESNARKAQRLFQQVRAKREDLNRDIMILGFLQLNSDYSDLLKDIPTIGEIDSEISRLSSNRVQSYDDLATDIIEQIDAKLKGKKTFVMGCYEWGNSGLASDFGVAFSSFLRASLEKQLGWSSPAQTAVHEISVFGEMIEEGKQICLFTRFMTKDMPVKTVISYLNPASIEKFGRQSIVPDKLKEFTEQDKVLKANAMQSSGLKIDVRTGEFGKNLAVYRFGDPVSILVRANKACWLHLLYFEADGTKTVIYENYYIASDMVNQWVLVTDDQVACEPAGIEQIWVQADTEKLPELNTRIERYDDKSYKKILKDSLEGTIAKTRGLKTKAKAPEFSEAFLTINIVDPAKL